jgi:hypothetical protein
VIAWLLTEVPYLRTPVWGVLAIAVLLLLIVAVLRWKPTVHPMRANRVWGPQKPTQPVVSTRTWSHGPFPTPEELGTRSDVDAGVRLQRQLIEGVERRIHEQEARTS